MDLVALAKKQLGKVGTVLAGDPRDEGLTRLAYDPGSSTRAGSPTGFGSSLPLLARSSS
jgi:hypothetical protein